MFCPNCHEVYTEGEEYCQQCGANLPGQVRSMVPLRQRNLPALLYNFSVPRGVAAGVGALALGVGVELLRRGFLARLSQPTQTVAPLPPAVSDVRDLLLPQSREQKQRYKLPKGYEVQETVVYMRRIIRRVN